MIEINIQLKNSQLKALQNNERLTINLIPPLSRKDKQQQLIDVPGRIPKNIAQLVEAWNESEYIRFIGINEKRNSPIDLDTVEERKVRFGQAIRMIGLNKILDDMSLYFEACKQRLHIWDGRSHGYAHLGGFMESILQVHLENPQHYHHVPYQSYLIYNPTP